MFVECIKNNGIPYLRLVQGVRVTNKDGYRTSQKKVILSIGPFPDLMMVSPIMWSVSKNPLKEDSLYPFSFALP